MFSSFFILLLCSRFSSLAWNNQNKIVFFMHIFVIETQWNIFYTQFLDLISNRPSDLRDAAQEISLGFDKKFLWVSHFLRLVCNDFFRRYSGYGKFWEQSVFIIYLLASRILTRICSSLSSFLFWAAAAFSFAASI